MIRFVDLFAGIGGIRLGFEQALAKLGIPNDCVLSSEIDDRARETYALNFKESPLGDIYTIKDFPSFDFLLAGFPCQPFSYAGKQRGFGDTRGTLFFEIEKRLTKYKPKGFLLENVRGLTTHDQGRTLQTVIKKLTELGYGVEYVVLNSSNFDVPQNRVRIYIVGLLGAKPQLTLQTNFGASDSHQFKKRRESLDLFNKTQSKVVADILEANPHKSYDCSPKFTKRIRCFIR